MFFERPHSCALHPTFFNGGMKIGEVGRADDGPAFAVTERLNAALWVGKSTGSSY